MFRILSFLLLAIPYFGFSQSLEQSYVIYDTKAKKTIPMEQLIHALKAYQVVFFGEEHNDSVTHILQQQVYQGWHQLGQNVSLSLEMLVTDDQLVLNEYLQGHISEKNFLKDVVLWNNWKDYSPLLNYAKSNQLNVIAANAPSRYTNRVTQHGLESLNILSETAKSFLPPLPIDTLTGAYYDKFIGLLGGHQGMGNMKIYQSQNLWDASMAHQIARHLKTFPKNKILHLCGRFHSDEYLGTYAQLHLYAPHTKVAVISCFPSEDFNQPDWSKHLNLGDYIILVDPTGPKTF
jgi:uncharacterized iron-regulated protein